MTEQARESSGGRTPPEIVAATALPEQALAAFIAQELEHWAFEVSTELPTPMHGPLTRTATRIVRAGAVELRVGVQITELLPRKPRPSHPANPAESRRGDRTA